MGNVHLIWDSDKTGLQKNITVYIVLSKLYLHNIKIGVYHSKVKMYGPQPTHMPFLGQINPLYTSVHKQMQSPGLLWAIASANS